MHINKSYAWKKENILTQSRYRTMIRDSCFLLRLLKNVAVATVVKHSIFFLL